ncbi:hypothetical protein BJ165DRAFT_1535568 [Panaeolus papilionaceus]|nr:hypothetical protein BJ165DRAFT_1535568 [Panaeolus papilionaceus]
MDPKDTGEFSPHQILLHKLTGVGLKKPQQEAIARAGPLKGKALRKKLASLREKVSSQMYARLNAEEKEGWDALAKEEHAVALQQYHDVVDKPPSETPEDRQKVIQGLAQFVQPILDLICEATGWKATLIAGGPEPADNGLLNIVSFHSGTTKGAVKMNFGHSEQVAYQKHLVPIYHSFLRKCYSVEECRERALPVEEGFETLEAMMQNNEYAATVHWGGYPVEKVTAPAVSSSEDLSRQGVMTGTTSHPPFSHPHSPRPRRSRSPTPRRSRSPTPRRSRSPTPRRSQSRSRSPSLRLSRLCSPQPRPTLVAHGPSLPLLSTSANSQTQPLQDSSLVQLPSRPNPVLNEQSPKRPDQVAKKRSMLDSDRENRETRSSPTKKQRIAQTGGENSLAGHTTPVIAPHSSHHIEPGSSSAQPSSLASSAPLLKWFSQSYKYFSQGSSALDFTPSTVLGTAWEDLLTEWAVFEKRFNYAETG